MCGRKHIILIDCFLAFLDWGEMEFFVALFRQTGFFVRFTIVTLGLLCLHSTLEAQPSINVVSHNITSKCPAIGVSYQAQVVVTGGVPYSVPPAPAFYRYALTADDAPAPTTPQAEIKAGVQKGLPLIYGESKLWIFDDSPNSPTPFQLADHLKDGGGQPVPIPKNIVLDPAHVQVSDVLCPGGSTGIIVAREGGEAIRYILLSTQNATSNPNEQEVGDVVIAVNGTGIFEGLAIGFYKVWIENADQCIFKYNKIYEVKDTPPWDATFVVEGAEKALCPGNKVDKVRIEVTGASGRYVRFTWRFRDVAGNALQPIITKRNSLDSVLPGEWKVDVVDNRGCEHTFSHTVPGSRNYAIKKPPTQITFAPCALYKENGELSYGELTNLTIEGGNTGAKRVTWLQVPEQVKELEGKPVSLESSTPYKLPHGEYTLLIQQGGCNTNFTFEMPYDATNQPKLELLNFPSVVCYGQELEFNLAITRASLLKTDPSNPSALPYEFLVYHNLDGDKEVRGKVLVKDPARRLFRVESHIYDRSSVTVSGKSTSGCLVSDSKQVQVVPPVSIAYDPNVSHAGVLYNGKVIDRKRSLNIGQANEVLYYYDSIALGVLEGAKTEVGFQVTGGKGHQLLLDIKPAGIFTPSSSGKAYLYDLQLPADAFQNPSYEIRTVSKDGYTYDFLRTTATVAVTRADINQTCYSEQDIYIRLVERLRVPNVFTPNGDGVNDRWLYNGDPQNINLYSHLQDLLPNIEVEVFTRAGVSVWYAKGAGIGQGWDGNVKGTEEPLPVGTYYYVIRFNAPGGGKKWKPVSGSVTIVR